MKPPIPPKYIDCPAHFNSKILTFLVHQHVKNLVRKKTTLYSDETSKGGEKYMGFHASDQEKQQCVLGVRDMATKSAEDTLKTFREVLHTHRQVLKIHQ